MNMEEMLTQILDGQKAINNRLDTMQDDINGMKVDINKRFDSMQSEIDSVKSDVLSIKVTIENEISPAIKTLSECQIENSKRLRNIENDITEIKDNSAIDEVLQDLRDMKRI